MNTNRIIPYNLSNDMTSIDPFPNEVDPGRYMVNNLWNLAEKSYPTMNDWWLSTVIMFTVIKSQINED